MIVNPTCVMFILASLAGATVSGFVSPNNVYTASRRTPMMSMDTGRSKISLKAATMETMSPSETFVSEEQETADDVQQNNKSYLDDGFVFGLEGSGLERPKGKAVSLVVEGDTLETTNQQIAFVSGTFLGHAAFYASALASMLSINGGNVALTAAQALGVTVSSMILADLGSGVLHWSVDNYGNGRTPIMGGIIASFQGHHSAPWTITQREFCNNVSKLCIPFGVPTVALINYIAGPTHPTSESIWSAVHLFVQTLLQACDILFPLFSLASDSYYLVFFSMFAFHSGSILLDVLYDGDSLTRVS